MAEQKKISEILSDKKLKSSLSWVIGLSVAALIGGVIIISSMGAGKPDPAVSGVNIGSATAPRSDHMNEGTEDVSNRVGQIAAAHEQERATDAEKSPDLRSSVTSASQVRFESDDPATHTVTESPALTGERAPQQPQPQQAVQQQPQQQVNPELVKEYYAGIGAAIKNAQERRQPPLSKSWSFGYLQQVRDLQSIEDQRQTGLATRQAELEMERLEQMQAATAANTSASAAEAAQQSGQSPDEQPVVVAGKGDVVTAVNLLMINTDAPGPAMAQIASGPLSGALIMGGVTRRDTRAVLTFNSLRLPAEMGGAVVPANAVSLDVEDLQLGNATDVDRHLFLRYGVRPVMAALATAAQALASSSMGTTTTTVLPNGASITQNGNGRLRGRDLSGVGIGAAASQLQTDINERSLEPTVRVSPNEMIGVLFLEDVLAMPWGQAGGMGAAAMPASFHPSLR